MHSSRWSVGSAAAVAVVIGIVAFACGDGNDAGPTNDADGGGGNPPQPDGASPPTDGGALDGPSPHPVTGSITVRCAPGSRALLGDGTKFNGVVPESGSLTFTDPSIQGPQTVSCVSPPGDAHVVITTWTGFDLSIIGSPPSPRTARPLARIAGAISEVDTGANGIVEPAASLGGIGSASILGDGPYGPIDVVGPPATTTFDVIAVVRKFIADGLTGRAGFKRDIPVPAALADGGAADLSGVDIALDHPFDQTIALSVDNLSAFPQWDTTFSLYRGDRAEIELGAGGGLPEGAPPSIRVPALTPPFDLLQTIVRVLASDGPGRTSSVSRLLPPGATSLSLALPSAPTVTSPATLPLAAAGQPPTAPFAAGFRLEWTSGNADAQIVRATVSTNPPKGQWTVYAALGTSSFTFFTPPADVTFFESNVDVVVSIEADRYDGASTVQALDAVADARTARGRYATQSATMIGTFHAQ
jgi:hypothetical protein